eukprot:2035027-Rhodomonas_salina.1
MLRGSSRTSESRLVLSSPRVACDMYSRVRCVRCRSSPATTHTLCSTEEGSEECVFKKGGSESGTSFCAGEAILVVIKMDTTDER